MLCPDGRKRHVHPIIASYVCDHPEQCQGACCRQNRCTRGDIDPKQRGTLNTCHLRDSNTVLDTMRKACEGRADAILAAEAQGLKLAYPPFWADLPYLNIYSCFTPDLLHQLHKGVFKDHLVKWCNSVMSGGQLDRRYMSMPSHPSLRHFKKGITLISQWTGKEYKQMEKVFVCAISGGITNERIVRAARGILDFAMLAQLPVHSTQSLADMKTSLEDFHQYKDGFVTEGVRKNFNIPKIHSVSHYVELIVSRGTADGYNTESPERLHIDYAKKGYRASNKRDYEKQMVRWVERQDAIAMFDAYIAWVRPQTVKPPVVGPLDADAAPDVDAAAQAPEEVLEAEEIRAASLVGIQRFGTQRTSYFLPKTIPLRNITVPIIQTHFHATKFLSSVNAYLHQHKLSHPHLRVPSMTEHDVFDIYKRV